MIILTALAVTAFGYVVMLLWNGLIPELFKGPVLSFPQAIGLLVLAKILFRGIGWNGRHRWKHHQWRERMQEKMNAMTPEEREKFRQQWERHCGKFGRWHQPPAEAAETKAT